MMGMVERLWQTPLSTTGMLSLDGIFNSYTLEPPAGPMLIPAGTYRAVKTMSADMGYVSFEFMDVPGHEGERLHIGNKPENTKGCTLLGQTHTRDWVGNSELAFDAFMAQTPDEMLITYMDVPAEEEIPT